MNANCDNLQMMVVTMIRGEKNQERVVIPWKNARNQLEVKNEKMRAEQ